MRKSISFEDAKTKLHQFIDEMDGMDMERLLAQEFSVSNVNYKPENDEVEFDPIGDYNGELE